MVHLSLADTIVILLYFAVVLYVGIRSARRTSATDEDFLLAGRSLTLPIFVMTLVSTWYGGVLGVGEFSYRFGSSNLARQGAPSYIFSAIFSGFVAQKDRASD